MTRGKNVILTDDEHRAALKEIDRLWHAKPGSPDADRLEFLARLVEAYERVRWPIGKPSADETLSFRREQQGLPPVGPHD